MSNGAAKNLMAEILHESNSRVDGVLRNVALHATVV